ncbi:hypothetical protein B0H13DRAFT_2552087 [Mycena leptocephala]|nr:hypothetical protein B0H13DRAFT_2552087 [Mycena leptocephala]
MTERSTHGAYGLRLLSPRLIRPICAIRPTQFPPLAVAAAGFLDGGTAGLGRRAELGEWWSREAPLCAEPREDEGDDHEVQYCTWCPLAHAPVHYRLSGAVYWRLAAGDGQIQREEGEGFGRRQSRGSSPRCAPATCSGFHWRAWMMQMKNGTDRRSRATYGSRTATADDQENSPRRRKKNPRAQRAQDRPDFVDGTPHPRPPEARGVHVQKLTHLPVLYVASRPALRRLGENSTDDDGTPREMVRTLRAPLPPRPC